VVVPAARPDIEGTGLGLAIAKAIADCNDFRLMIVNRQDAAEVVLLLVPILVQLASQPAATLSIVIRNQGVRIEVIEARGRQHGRRRRASAFIWFLP
jgi:hypothetical protein